MTFIKIYVLIALLIGSISASYNMLNNFKVQNQNMGCEQGDKTFDQKSLLFFKVVIHSSFKGFGLHGTLWPYYLAAWQHDANLNSDKFFTHFTFWDNDKSLQNKCAYYKFAIAGELYYPFWINHKLHITDMESLFGVRNDYRSTCKDLAELTKQLCE